MTRSHEIAGVLRDEILRGQFRPGERLPSERDLAARFGASRGAVREALTQIEQLRLIDIQAGGARIKEVNDASIAVLGPLLGLGSVPDAALVDQFLDTFSALARFTATRAIPRITEIQRTDLLTQLDAMAVDLRQRRIAAAKDACVLTDPRSNRGQFGGKAYQ
jgi:GntR family transcriptional repressor for pyruvate dehydrogenase complex